MKISRNTSNRYERKKPQKVLKFLIRNLPSNCFSVFDYFVGLAIKGLRKVLNESW